MTPGLDADSNERLSADDPDSWDIITTSPRCMIALCRSRRCPIRYESPNVTKRHRVRRGIRRSVAIKGLPDSPL